MKKLLLLTLAACLTCTVTFAKKVKFAVDMTGQTVSANGVHLTGDLQVPAGYPANWAANTTLMGQEGSSSIYSIVVDIPAFQKYEYKFVNGDQLYELEFVPEESRIGHNFNDNRWVYVDSLANDTMQIGAILFGGNAPSGLSLIRFKVDVRNEASIAATGAHVAGSFQGSNPATTRLYSFGDSLYEHIAYVTPGTYSFKYYNGNAASAGETVPAACATNGLRTVAATTHTVLSVMCFSACTECNPTAVANAVATSGGMKVYPNPAADYATIEFGDGALRHDVVIADAAGRVVRNYAGITGSIRIDRDGLQAGLYLLKATAANGVTTNMKLILR